MMMMETHAKIIVFIFIIISVTSIIDEMKYQPSAKFNHVLPLATGVPEKRTTSAWFFNGFFTGDVNFFNRTKPEQSGCFFFFLNSWSDKEISLVFDVSEVEKEFER